MKINKKVTALTLTGLLIISSASALLGSLSASGNPSFNINAIVTNYGNGHESLNESPFSKTSAGAVANDFMQYVVKVENSGDDAHDVKIKVNLPSQTVVGKKAAAYVVGSAAFDVGPVDVGAQSIKYFHGAAEVTPAGSDAQGRDENVDAIEYSLTKIPSGSVGSANREILVQYSVRMATNIGDNVVADANSSAVVTSAETSAKSANDTHIKLSGKPEFKAAADTFRVQAGPNEESDDWKNDSVEIDSGSDAFLGVWVKNLFHNTTANNSVIEVTWPQEYKSEHTLTATISSSNAATVTETAKIKIKNGEENKLEVIDGSLMYLNYNNQSIGATITKTANGFKVVANDGIVGGNANVTLVNAHLKATKRTTPTTNEKVVEKTFVSEKVQDKVTITELPKTGPEDLPILGLLGAVPAGFVLRKFRKGSVADDADLSTLVGKRQSRKS